jgi:hypothetical protein
MLRCSADDIAGCMAHVTGIAMPTDDSYVNVVFIIIIIINVTIIINITIMIINVINTIMVSALVTYT